MNDSINLTNEFELLIIIEIEYFIISDAFHF
jgi:hypothetical protein